MKKEKIEHRIIEKTDWIMPTFIIFLSWGSTMLLSYLATITLYSQTENKEFTIIVMTMVWIIWGWTIIKNKIWRPDRTKIVEHHIVV